MRLVHDLSPGEVVAASDRWHARGQFVWLVELAGRRTLRRIGHEAIRAVREEVVHGHGGAERRAAPQQPGMGRNGERDPASQVRRDPLKAGPLVGRLTYLVETRVLQIANTAVQQLRRRGRRRAAEIRALDERNVEAALGGVVRQTGARDPPADDCQVEHPVLERVEIALHAAAGCRPQRRSGRRSPAHRVGQRTGQRTGQDEGGPEQR